MNVQMDTDAERLRALARRLGLAFVDLDAAEIDKTLFTYLPVALATRLHVIPIAVVEDRLQVAVSDPLDLDKEKQIVRAAKLPLDLVVSTAKQISSALRRAESSGQFLDAVQAGFSTKLVREDSEGKEQIVDLETVQDQSGAVLLTNSILMAGLQKQVSDIHIEAFSDRIDLKYRIDGVLYPATESIDTRHHPELVSRIKVMAELDTAEKRKPQDGRFRLRIEGRDVDFRVSILPTQYGEDVVIRVLDKTAVSRFGADLTLGDLGLNSADMAWLREAVRVPHGLVLITGPTGSGKTTTLYAALSELASGSEKIITIEDPVEYEIDGIVQIAVSVKKGLSFATGLKSILRHDPDRIMVGEIRDLETAEIAIQAALTGHLVLASVHANNAVEVLSRFTHWGVDRHDFVTALNAVIAQRLLRRLCPHCRKQSHQTGIETHQAKQAQSAEWIAGDGCGQCRGTGYAGRIAVIERFAMTPDLAERMIARVSANALTDVVRASGMQGLHEQALDLVRCGITSRVEVERVIAGR